jgi:L-ribulokinase
MAGGPRYTVGIDFGTASARAVVVDVADGREVGVAVHPYANGVIDERLPEPDEHASRPGLGAPYLADYVESLRRAVPAAVADAGVDSDDVMASASPPPRDDAADDRRRTPLCHRRIAGPTCPVKPEAPRAQPEADEINNAAELGEPWLARYGGRISSEWFFPRRSRSRASRPAPTRPRAG